MVIYAFVKSPLEMQIYMIIDFHTHTYPDKVAEKAVKKLYDLGGTPCFREPTLEGLIESTKKSGIDYSLSLPVATSPSQVEHINNLSAEMSGRDNVIFAGAIHPDSENVEEILDFIKNAGLKVIKIHPDYQGANFDDERYIKVMYEAAKRGIYTVTHAGVDAAYREKVHCTPDMILNVLDRLKGIIDNKLILAHMGSNELADEVIDKLCGKPVYFDTAYTIWKTPYRCEEIIKKHGADKILFATDSPWAPQEEFIDIINSYDLSDEDKEKILGENGRKILGI